MSADLHAELERANRLEYAAERIRGRGMNHMTVQAAAAELAKINGAPVELEELQEHDPRPGVGIRWRAATGHRLYRVSTPEEYRDLTGMLFAAGYPEAPYGTHTVYGMLDADGTRGRCSVVIVKPEAVAR